MSENLDNLNEALYKQLGRLSTDDLTEHELSFEIDRAKAITQVSREIVATGNMAIKAYLAQQEYAPQATKPKLPVALRVE